jgi:hypothetical protein
MWFKSSLERCTLLTTRKVYAADMPSRLPPTLLIRRLAQHVSWWHYFCSAGCCSRHCVAGDIAVGDCLDMEDVFHDGGFHVRLVTSVLLLRLTCISQSMVDK